MRSRRRKQRHFVYKNKPNRLYSKIFYINYCCPLLNVARNNHNQWIIALKQYKFNSYKNRCRLNRKLLRAKSNQ